jgi:hypothetical protein
MPGPARCRWEGTLHYATVTVNVGTSPYTLTVMLPTGGQVRAAGIRCGAVFSPDTAGSAGPARSDFNLDDRSDILWRHVTQGDVWIWLMDGTTKLSETWAGTVPDTGYRIVR